MSDDSRPVPAALTPLWQAVSGAGVVEFFTPSSVDTGISFSASATYRLRLTVGDGAITTFDETTASISAAPLLAWRQTDFVLALNRDPQRTDVTITIESCTDLGGTWTPSPAAVAARA